MVAAITAPPSTPAKQVIRLPRLHTGQAAVQRSTARFRVVAKGRRWGGSFLGVLECIAETLRGGHCWLIAPTFPNSNDRWNELKMLARQIPDLVIREEPRSITDKRSGGMVEVKSASQGNTLRGAGLSLIVCDEFAYFDESCDSAYLWSQVLRPMLATTRGRALFLSSPNGLNSFHTLYGYGVDPARPEWQAFKMPTSSNPFVPVEEIAAMRESMTELEARQELDAEFVDLTGAVFRNIGACIGAEPQTAALPGHTYLIGCDIAKHQDFSVFAVIDATLHPPSLVALDRQNEIDFGLQAKRLKALCERFSPSAVIVEANNAGDAFIEMAVAEGIEHLQPLTTTNATKAAQVEALAIAFERRAIALLDNKVLQLELMAFTAKRLPSGLLRYAASGRNHDDCVMALMLAWSAVQGKSSAAFITAEQWDTCAAADIPHKKTVVVAIYGGIGDPLSLVGMSKTSDGAAVQFVHIFEPSAAGVIDFTAVEAVLDGVRKDYYVAESLYDEVQHHALAQRLNKGHRWFLHPYPPADRPKADKFLLDAITTRRIVHDGNPVLREHILNAETSLTDGGKLRIVARAAHLPISAAIALSMAHVEARRLNI